MKLICNSNNNRKEEKEKRLLILKELSKETQLDFRRFFIPIFI